MPTDSQDAKIFKCDYTVYDVLDRPVCRVTDIREVIGRGSSPELANAVARHSPETYAAIRKQAVEAGIIDKPRSGSLFPLDREPLRHSKR